MAEREYQLSHDEVRSKQGAEDNSAIETKGSLVLLLDGISDPKNLGSIFRLADAAGIQELYGYRCGDALDEKKLNRISRQTAEHIRFRELVDLVGVQELIQDKHSVALEYTNKSVPFHGFYVEGDIVLIIGNEQHGVSEELLQLCRSSVHIPMLGRNSSMNVSVATGIVVYHLLGGLGEI